MSDEYRDLKEASPQELLEAAIAAYRQFNPEAERWMRLGFALAQKTGWEQVAPYWLRMWRQNPGWKSCSACGRKLELCDGKLDCPDCTNYERAYFEPKPVVFCPKCSAQCECDDLGCFCPNCELDFEH